MINRQQLLADLQKFLQRIEADLLERSESTEVPEVRAALHAEYEKAAKAERTAQNYEDWRTDTITQAAAAWVLSCVFVRFLEDNSLIEPPKIAGPGDRLARARDEHELYFRSHPQHTDREYLLSIFSELAKLPGTKDIFGEHNAINDLPNWLSGDAAGELLNFFQKIDASTGDLVHDFTDSNWDTRFLGDLYQDLSEAARKKFALLQTPDFVEEFILDRTLELAIEEFGLVPPASANTPKPQTCFKMIDPACGSGHFLLGAFPRLLDRWQRKEPGTKVRELTQRALDSIHGVDINPFAVAIAKFRLLLVAMKACDIRRLLDAPAFHINVACGDSLLHGENRTSSGQKLWDYAEGATDEELYSHSYPGEDLQTVRAFLKPGSYQCVVANPPYIVPRDKKLSAWYRQRYATCSDQYSLASPFMELMFILGVERAFVGQITTASFMKREYGKKLVESLISKIDLTDVIDSSGAYIPGHNNAGDGTTTVILFARNRPPVSHTVRTIIAVKSEGNVIGDPAQGLAWLGITEAVRKQSTFNEYVVCEEFERTRFRKHPWVLVDNRVNLMQEAVRQNAEYFLGDITTAIGRGAHTGEDDAYVSDESSLLRFGLPRENIKPFIAGEDVRDWVVNASCHTLFPYGADLRPVSISNSTSVHRYLWRFRDMLWNRTEGSGTHRTIGMTWHEFSRFHPERFIGCGIVHAELASHNHFVPTPGESVYNRSAPIIKFDDTVTTHRSFGIAGCLNSSVALFWGRAKLFPKGGFSSGKWEERIVWNSTNMQAFPIPKDLPSDIVTQVESVLRNFVQAFPRKLNIDNALRDCDLQGSLAKAKEVFHLSFGALVSLQEEIDWFCYSAYGLCNSAPLAKNPPRIALGHRAFEIVLARKCQSNKSISTWFERHGSTPITELPMTWPGEYSSIVEARIELIENDPNIRVIEQPEYKRRWTIEPWGSQLERALREWLLLRVETYFDFDSRMTDAADASERPVAFGEIAIYSVAQLADAARRDPQFMEVGELYRDDPAFDVQSLVEELVLAESVPHLPILRYKDSGLRKRAEWDKTWDLQRREDAGESVGTIPVPPKYTSADFISTGGARYWSLRGKLDVPKERWISFPHCEGPDGTLVICWAGYDHLQQAQAISAYYVRVQTEFGGSDDPRLIPLLASLIELLPWLKQWHNEPNANFDGLRMGDYFEGFVNEEARTLGKTLAEIKAWVPPKKVAKTAKPKKAKKSASKATLDGDE